ncbi:MULTISPECIES: VOC family protein [unclassified Streptomyces]|uniref:VOC family protein n=1 Tax=unclassified Streptomyces TaxID=2593676 RepID=UPI003829F610
MITTEATPGTPCWLDLGTPDVRAAAAFYGSVLGWEYTPMGGVEAPGGAETPDGMEGGMFRKDGKTVAGLGSLTEEGARSAWMIYYAVEDADATTRAVRDAGGAVRVAPTALEDWGTMAQYTDPLGGEFAVWQPGRDTGFELVEEPGSLAWTELCTTDAAASREFYGGTLGWWFSEMRMPGGEGLYTLITAGGLPEERMHGGLMEVGADALAPSGGRPYWHPVFAVTDCDAAAAAVTAHGGTVPTGPVDAEGVGRLAVCADPWRADFVVLAPAGN